MNSLHAMLNQQRQSASALSQQAADLAAATRQQMEGMAAEQRAELARLSNANIEVQSKQRISEEASIGLPDVVLEQRNAIGELTSRQGVVTNNTDARHTRPPTTPTTTR